MKILLLGEYSGVHTHLCKALKERKHEVLMISNGDSYKSFNSDLNIDYKYLISKNPYIKKIINIYYIFLMYSGLKGCIQIFKHIGLIKKLKNFDVVQLINPLFLADYGSIVNFFVFLYIKKNNKKVFLCALGDDYYWVKYCLNGGFKYSIFNKLSLKTLRQYLYPLHYIYGFFNPFLNKYIVKNVNAVIPGLYDYLQPYKSFKNCSEVIPIIVPIDSKEINKLEFPVKIFHGWQPGKEFRKGNDIFDKAIKFCLEKYPDKIEYKIIGGVPYSEYIKTYDECHIFIDQCYSQDSGVNGLLGMASGKVVLGGFELEVQKMYGINYMPMINCRPDIDQIIESIENLIVNHDDILSFSKKAKKYILDFHSEKYVLELYEKVWAKS